MPSGDNNPMPMPGAEGTRIWIVGPPGAGKSRLLGTLATALGIHAVMLDALYWKPGWQRTDSATFHKRLSDEISADNWIVDGFYDEVADIIADRATLLVHLDPSRPVALYRLMKRTLLHMVTNHRSWTGQRESVRRLFSSQSVILFQWRIFDRIRELGYALTARFRQDGRQALRARSADEALAAVLHMLEASAKRFPV